MSRQFLESVFGVEFTDKRPLELDSHVFTPMQSGGFDVRVSHLDFDFKPLVEGDVLFHNFNGMRNTREVNGLIYGDRCDWWVVEYPEGVLQFRLCSAMKGCGYPAFAAGRFIPADHPDYEKGKAHLLENAKCLAERGW